ncbi:unnamed protein product [Phytophthora lilii]|uniref:Unnamed protein product n=1 Tax=Phytophthora lilii TaxID=2077276 RepID=A0A9W6WQM6_9STRA|nr:unnamed protein product [Phytophthora lilii]
MELVRDTHASLEDTDSNATKQRHYDVLDLCAGTLSILLVQSFDQHSECNSEQFETPSTSGFGAAFVDVVVKLLESDHPVEFRVSFSRVVPAMSLLIPGSVKSSDASVISALCSAVFDLYREVSEFRPLDATTSTDTPVSRDHVFPLTSIRRVAYAFQVLVETSASLQQFVQIKHALPFVMTSIKELFTAVRVAGGFGGKRARTSNTSSSTQDVFVLDICGRIQTHMEVMSAVVGGNKENQQLAQGLLYVVLSNWSVMKTAHVRGSQLLLCALHLLANYIYGNDTTRDSLLISLPPASGKAVGDKSQTLLSLLLSLASTRGEIGASSRHVGNSVSPSAADTALSNAACEVLKAVLHNTECVLASVKTGSISKLIDSLQERLKQARQTRKTHGLELENLAHMLSVLSGIACNEEGARVLYVNWSTVLSLVFGDAIHSSDAAVRHAGCLFMRNLALSESTKNHFAVWEELLDEVVAACIRASSTTATDVTTLQYLSATLWSLVFDNQRARALLLSRPTALQNLHELLTLQQAQSTTRDIAENLRRVLLLVQE